jgi:hypothetical protein
MSHDGFSREESEQEWERAKIYSSGTSNGADSQQVDSTPSWDNPDLSILNEGKKAPPAFSPEPFGPFWGEWIERMAQLKGAPPDYVASSLVTVASSLIGNARRVSPWKEWVEPPVIRITNVGLPSSNKSPGQDATLDLVNKLQQELLPEHDEQKRKWEGEREAAGIALENWKNEIKDAVKKRDSSAA